MDSPELMQLGIALLAAVAFAAVAFTIIQPLVSGDRQKDKRVSDVTESATAASRRRPIAAIRSRSASTRSDFVVIVTGWPVSASTSSRLRVIRQRASIGW